ncbi:EFR1 family ferrodoxin [Bacteroidota bacterium]
MMGKYNKVIIYYFTGTGNSLKAGRWICQEAEKRKIETRMYPIDDDYKPDIDEIDNKTLIGFLSPTHGFNISPSMLKFIAKFPRGVNADIFILNTRAGLKIFDFFLPGISGAAQFLPIIILKLKGYSVMGGLPLDMPSNWLFFHSGLKKTKVESIVERCEWITKEFTNNILSGKKIFRKMVVTLPLDIALLPITFLYYVYGRYIFAKTMIYTDSCNNCKICSDNCPTNAIKIVNDRPYWTYSCEGCMRCINNCPKTSIQSSHLIFLIILIIPGIIFNDILLKYFQVPEIINYDIVLTILEMGITLFELFVMYAIIQRFLRYKYFAKFFKYTSLSAYWRRYMAPGISKKDFKKNKNLNKYGNN